MGYNSVEFWFTNDPYIGIFDFLNSTHFHPNWLEPKSKIWLQPKVFNRVKTLWVVTIMLQPKIILFGLKPYRVG
jgi:hypothetical protein